MPLTQLDDDLFVHTGTCNCYILRDGDAALLIDLGDGEALSALPGLGIGQVEWVLFTSHHRELCQGAPRLDRSITQCAAPAAEREFFEAPLQFRKMQPRLEDAYTCHSSSYLRPPREPIALDRVFTAHDSFEWRGHEFWAVQTPGASPGGMSYLLRRPDGWLAFSGGVMQGGARLRNWYDSETDYGWGAAIGALHDSAFALERFAPRLMLPSHGRPIANPAEQLALYRQKLRQFHSLYVRGWDTAFSSVATDAISKPTAAAHVWQISPHLFKFTGSGFGGNFHMVLADDGHALFIDCGLWGAEWLEARITRMKERLGLRCIDAVVVTHMHGDHCLDCAWLREAHGAQIWTLEGIEDKLERPERFDYTCPIQAYPDAEPLPVDRTFARGEKLSWHGFEFTFDWLPGQTELALVMHGQVDGKLIAFTGDNLFRSEASGHEALIARNGAVLERGYLYTARYLKALQPDMLMTGHSGVIENPGPQVDRLLQWAEEMRAALVSLSAEEHYEYFLDAFWLRAEPYRTTTKRGDSFDLELTIRNYEEAEQKHQIQTQAPRGWSVVPPLLQGAAQAGEACSHSITVTVPADAAAGLYLLAVDVTRNGHRYGELFDAIVLVE